MAPYNLLPQEYTVIIHHQDRLALSLFRKWPGHLRDILLQ